MTAMCLARPVLIAATVLCLNGACGPSQVPVEPVRDPIEVDLTAALARAAKEGRPVFVHFTAHWCAPCKELKATVYPDPVVASRLAQFVRAEVDIESPDGNSSARRYGVQTVPVLMTTTPQGEELRSLRVVGACTASELAAVLDKALAQSLP